MVTPNSDSVAPRVGIVTVSYGSIAVLGPFLESVGAATTEPAVIVVADNRPEHEVEQIAERFGAQYVPMPSNDGYGAGMNAAAAALPASVEWVLISNPDVVLEPGSVDTLLKVGQEDPAIAAIGPAIRNSDGSIYPSARAVPSLRTGVGHALFTNFWPGNPWTAAYLTDTESSPTRRDTGWLSGACMLVRRSSFDELEGFDPGYFMYFEDVDLGYRLGKAGYRNVYEPAATITHTGAHSTTTESARMVAVHHDSARRFLGKKYSRAVLWPIRVSLNLGLRMRSAVMRRRLHG
jgi:N-acetylglucosaminyl-diphospho-decaprenol L-rhamnosyltransferase